MRARCHYTMRARRNYKMRARHNYKMRARRNFKMRARRNYEVRARQWPPAAREERLAQERTRDVAEARRAVDDARVQRAQRAGAARGTVALGGGWSAR